ncbi:Bug family tripartite tricarboxylate transporter substrate binding protein [Priestia taiwanensis]|uniref:Tricarboxylic transport TctC n=1 Tax=Priestia taiwanensis TaxID=1347902 RepID=A0A917AL73_9BACI|nr:tripartite tricarboxylate transporter substrate binding protein [Priestia taiwanensis]MBM7362193.1 putative tricarboxylic transport membrane protein [Priestia taiwanensis]GGE60133.1 tricarboxylic transport TctC [Priestia taiwanensis]
MKMKRTFALLATGALAIGLAACTDSSKETGSKEGSKSKYPEKAITVVAPSGAGGGWDITARTFVKVLTETKLVEQSMTVENKPGGGGATFMAQYATQDTKNNEKLFVNSPPILINNLKKEGNSPFGYKDTTPLAQLTRDYGALVVAKDSKYTDLKSLLTAMKEAPASINLAGGSAPGSMDHLIGVLPAYKFGVDPLKVKYIPYDGGGEALTALLGGNADVIATDVSSVKEQLKAGKVRVLGITAAERQKSEELKDIPTMKEQGVDAEFTIWRGVFGPKEMSKDAQAYWKDSIDKLAKSKEWKDEVKKQGWEEEYKNSDDFKKFLGEQEKQIQELLKALNMAK